MIDGSSIAGWKAINRSDMSLVPDWSKCFLDPFAAQPTLKVFCMIVEPSVRRCLWPLPASDRDQGRSLRQNIGHYRHSLFRPRKPNYFVFDDVKYDVKPHRVLFELDSLEGPYNTAKAYPEGNTGHRPRASKRLAPKHRLTAAPTCARKCSQFWQRSAYRLKNTTTKWRPPQHELGIFFSTLVDCADNMQLQIRGSQRRAYAAKRQPSCPSLSSATMDRACTFTNRCGTAANPLSPAINMQACPTQPSFYIGGIIKHARALNAFTNPSVNSKRLVPGYEAPVLLAYSARNRSTRAVFRSAPRRRQNASRSASPTRPPTRISVSLYSKEDFRWYAKTF